MRHPNFLMLATRLAASIVLLGVWAVLWQPQIAADGTLAIRVLAPGPVGWVASWLAMLLPAYFIATGFLHTEAVDAGEAAGLSYTDFLIGQARQAVVPAALLAGLGALTSTAALWIGQRPLAEMISSQTVYLLWLPTTMIGIIAAGPWLVWLYDRYGILTVAGSVAASLLLTGLLPVAVPAADTSPILHSLQVLLVWPACYQLGIALQRGWLRRLPDALVAVAVGVAALAIGTIGGAWPPSSLPLGDAPRGNVVPPTLAMVALGVAQTGVLAVLRRLPALRRPPRRVRSVIERTARLCPTLILWSVPLLAAQVGMVWALGQTGPGVADALTSPAADFVLGPLLVALVSPLVLRLERRFVPPVRAARPWLAFASCMTAMAGTWTLWLAGVIVHPQYPLSSLGVLLLAAGTGMLTASTHGYVPPAPKH